MWVPNKSRLEDSQLLRFIAEINKSYHLNLHDAHELHKWSVENSEAFWSSVWDFCGVIGEKGTSPFIRDRNDILKAAFFPDAKLNFAENLLKNNSTSPAIIFHGEDKVRRDLSWNDLNIQVLDLQKILINHGINAGDVVAGYLPNMPETIIAMLAATSIGAIWTSCSPDFGVSGVVDRFGQTQPKILFTADYYYYKGEKISLEKKSEEIKKQIPSIRALITISYEGRDAQECVPTNKTYTKFPFSHPLYILYSSGTTGKPKCIVHSAGGTLLEHLKELILHTEVISTDKIFYQTTCGWMMWNWLVSSLATGATVVLYDGFPLLSGGKILFDIIDKEKVTIFGTNAKFLSLLEKDGFKPNASHSLASLKAILSTGSPLLPESFEYVYKYIKEDVCLSSISGGTDILGCFALGSPTLPVYKGELQLRSLGLNVQVYNDKGESIIGEKGELVCTAPFPSRPIGFWKDHEDEKYKASYYLKFPNVWHHGDYVEITKNNGMIFYGRSDSVLNPGGVRIGTSEIYRQVEKLPEIKESVAVGKESDGDIKIILFVIIKEGCTLNDDLKERIKSTIRDNTSPYHVPKEIISVLDIPRTRNGKISESAVRDVINGREIKNIDSLSNPECLYYFNF